MSADSLVVCRMCRQGWEGAAVGDTCPSGDRGVLVDAQVDAAHPDDALLGRTVGGRYAVVDVLGEGGMGAVYLAIQEPVRRYVALKCMLASVAADPETRARFYREARVVASLTDPAVVSLIDFGEDRDGSLFQAFEFVDGRELRVVLHEEGPFDPHRAVRIAVGILGGLADAHALGVVHRDLKPENVMVAVDALGDERARLLDFGIARLSHGGVNEDLTRAGHIVGTPVYMSPEQIRGGSTDGRSDLYAVGILLYEMLAGRVPFDHRSPLELMRAHAEDPPPPLDAPPGLQSVVARALAKAPEGRFRTAADMVEALRRALPDESSVRTAEMPAARTAPVLTVPAVEVVGPPSTLTWVLGGLVFLLAGALVALVVAR